MCMCVGQFFSLSFYFFLGREAHLPEAGLPSKLKSLRNKNKIKR